MTKGAFVLNGKTKVICVVGPTASGKTELAARLARELGGEVVSADSMQIYRGLSIGTAKPTEAEMLGVPHHMFDIVDADEEYSAARYAYDAGRAVDDIAARGRVPIIAGGTGLYISSLVRGFDFNYDKKCDIMVEERSSESEMRVLRERLEALYDRFGGQRIWRLLQRRDSASAAKIHPNDRKRVVRALEHSFSGEAKSESDAKSRTREPRYDALWLGLDYRDRAKLYDRINLRADLMLEAGILDEARELRGRYGTAAQAIGYKELYPALDDPSLIGECLELMKRSSRRYAKRQLTWFRVQENVNWMMRDEMTMDEILRVSTESARSFLYNTNER